MKGEEEDRDYLPFLQTKPRLNRERVGPVVPKREIFTHFSLTLDKETAKYIPYDSVAFPKLAAPSSLDSKAMAAELDSLWMVGFLDHETRTEKDANLRDIGDFIGLPEGLIVPQAGVEMRKIYMKEQRREVAETQRVMRGLSKEQKKRLLSRKQVQVRLSDELNMRLKELGESQGGATIGASKEKAQSIGQRVLRRSRGRRKLASLRIYQSESKRIRKVLLRRRPRKLQTKVRSRAMEDLFELKRTESDACLTIQRWYRRCKIHDQWKLALRKSRAAGIIQKHVRGMITRSLVKIWLVRRTWLVILVQSYIRGNQSRVETHKLSIEWFNAAQSMQRIVRGYLSRIRAVNVRGERAAAKIQKVWRGSIARVLSDRIWLDDQAVKIQRIARGVVGRTLFKKWHGEANKAAVVIQKAIRSMSSCMVRDKLLWERDIKRRKELLKVLQSEDIWLSRELTRYTQYIEKHDLRSSLKAEKKRARAMEDSIREKEWDFLALQRERNAIDPTGVRQGWTEELDRYIIENREWVTNAKFEYLFVDAFKHRTLEKELHYIDEHIDCIRKKKEEIQQWFAVETKEVFERVSKDSWRKQRKQRRVNVAQQRRRWTVQWHTPDGKKDTKRRPGYPWSPEVFAADTAETFNIGSIDLFANEKSLNANKGSFEKIVDQVSLQNAQNQIQQLSELFAPLANGVEAMFRALSQSQQNETT